MVWSLSTICLIFVSYSIWAECFVLSWILPFLFPPRFSWMYSSKFTFRYTFALFFPSHMKVRAIPIVPSVSSLSASKRIFASIVSGLLFVLDLCEMMQFWMCCISSSGKSNSCRIGVAIWAPRIAWSVLPVGSLSSLALAMSCNNVDAFRMSMFAFSFSARLRAILYTRSMWSMS